MAVGSLVSRSQISAQSTDVAEKREQQQCVLTLCPAFNLAIYALGTSFLKAMKNRGIEELPVPLLRPCFGKLNLKRMMMGRSEIPHHDGVI